MKLRKEMMSSFKNIGAIILLLALIVGGTLGLGTIKQRQAKAQIINFTVGDLESILQFIETEGQEITKDQIRKIIMEKLVEKMTDKIVGGESGGIGGGAGGTTGGGQGAFINDYFQYIYAEASDDVSDQIDNAYDALFPSYINNDIKELVKQEFDDQPDLVADDCQDASSIDFTSDLNAADKLDKALQLGCNGVTAIAILDTYAGTLQSMIAQASITEALANEGLVKKDEKTNKLEQSGQTYEAIIQAQYQGLTDVQTNNESSFSNIIGALLDQVLDQLLDKSYQ